MAKQIMKRIIYNKVDKKKISTLPVVTFPGKIYIVNEEQQAKEAVDYLLEHQMLGIDTETRPVFKKGKSRPVSLLQVSTFDMCFLFRLNQIGITEDIKRLLQSENVLIVGLSLHDDIMALHKRSDFKPGNFVDLQNIVGKMGIEDLSLQKLYANIFNQKISKRQRLSNWDAEELTEQQMAYAATDAWACIMLYREIKELYHSKNYELVIKETAEPEQKTNNNDEQ